MRDDADDKIARRFSTSQFGFAHRLGDLHLVAHMFLPFIVLPFGRVGRIRIVWVLHTIRRQLFFVFELD